MDTPVYASAGEMTVTIFDTLSNGAHGRGTLFIRNLGICTMATPMETPHAEMLQQMAAHTHTPIKTFPVCSPCDSNPHRIISAGTQKQAM